MCDSAKQQTVRIAVAVVEHNDQFLIGPRPDGVVLAGYWEFPGGKVRVDSGEHPNEAAVRECFEETGLKVVVKGEFPSQVHTYAHGTVYLHFISCTAIDPSQEPLAPFRWVPRNQLDQFRFPDGNKQLLDMLVNDLAP